MANRWLIAFLLVPLVPLLFLLAPGWALVIVVAFFSAGMAVEILQSTGFAPQKRMYIFAGVWAAFIPPWLAYLGEYVPVEAVIFVPVAWCSTMAVLSKGKVRAEGIAWGLFAALIIPRFLASLVAILNMEHGRLLAWMPLVTACFYDACSMFGGKKFGRRKLAPVLSPKKTVEGALAGLIGAIGFMLIYALLIQSFGGVNPSWPLIVFYAVAGSAAAQLGDLAFSAVKRERGMKDYGTILQSHGGLLDRFDSILFTAALMEGLLVYLPVLL